jgi:type IV pilus assembly protein PilA
MLHLLAKKLKELHEVERDERGFTLIELLVVILIIAILAAIALPVFLAQRERAWEATAASDARNAAAAATSCFVETEDFQDCDETALLVPYGFNRTAEVAVAYSSDADDWCITATHNSGGNPARWQSWGGEGVAGQVQQAAGLACAAPPA